MTGPGDDRGRRAVPQRAVAVVVRAGRALVMTRHREGIDYAVLPGGGVEAGESVAEAVLRELAEETSLTGVVGEVLWVRDDDGRRATYIEVLDATGTPRLGGPEQARSSPTNRYRSAWVGLDDLERLDLRPAALRPLLRGLLAGRP
jgi:8-oxo-dGTP pyrophosphatase MutT (NUDIX family)